MCVFFVVCCYHSPLIQWQNKRIHKSERFGTHQIVHDVKEIQSQTFHRDVSIKKQVTFPLQREKTETSREEGVTENENGSCAN